MIATMKTLDELNERYATRMKAGALVAKAAGIGLYRENWARHLEAVGYSRYIEPLTKGSIEAGTANDPVWAGPVSALTEFSDAFLALLRPRCIVDQVAGVRTPMNVAISADSLDDDARFSFVEEGAPKPVTAFSFERVNLPSTKIAGVIVVSDEAAKSRTGQTILEGRLLRALQRGCDYEFLTPSESVATGVQPGAITYGATEIASSGSSAAAVESDLGEVVLAVSQGKPVSPFIVASPEAIIFLASLRSSGSAVFPNAALVGGSIWGIPLLSSTEAGPYVVCIDGAGVAVADGGIVISPSRQGAIQMSDAPSSPNSLVSLWQNNLIGLRAERWVSWAKRADAVAFLQLQGAGSPP